MGSTLVLQSWYELREEEKNSSHLGDPQNVTTGFTHGIVNILSFTRILLSYQPVTVAFSYLVAYRTFKTRQLNLMLLSTSCLF